MKTFRRVTFRAFMRVNYDFDMWDPEGVVRHVEFRQVRSPRLRTRTPRLTSPTASTQVPGCYPLYIVEGVYHTRWDFIQAFILTDRFRHGRGTKTRLFWSQEFHAATRIQRAWRRYKRRRDIIRCAARVLSSMRFDTSSKRRRITYSGYPGSIVV